MSRAFIKETDEPFEPLPDRPISPHPNFVTSKGLEQIQSTLARLRQEYGHAHRANDQERLARIARDVRYWSSRESTAQVIPAPTDTTAVHFGCTVTIERESGRRERYRIVGEDEADPSRGTLSHVAPLARALMGKQVGDVVAVGTSEAEIIEIAVC